MRSACIFLAFIIVALTVFDIVVAEQCPPENCLPPYQCEEFTRGGTCRNSQLACCSVVKSEYRTACRHHGGECMNTCARSLRRQVRDCPGEVCCVLV